MNSQKVPGEYTKKKQSHSHKRHPFNWCFFIFF